LEEPWNQAVRITDMVCSKVVVLVLSYNGKHLLEEALSSYLKCDYPNYELVVIDNGSRDGTRDFVGNRFRRVKVIRAEKNLGYSGGLNLGLDYAFNSTDAEFVLISNNDVKIDKNAISELVKIAKTDKKIGFVTGKVYYYERPNVLQTVGKHADPVRWNGDHIGNREEDIGQYDTVSDRFFIDDIYTLVSRDMYKSTGGYDTTFFLESEEYDWQARAKKLGYKIMYTPYAKLWHKESMTIGKDSGLKAYYDARNPMLVVLLHKSPAFFRKYFWFHLRLDIFRGSLVSLKQGKIVTALAKWLGFFEGLHWAFRNKKISVRHFI
jgi:GT2 family glycosyltransferase